MTIHATLLGAHEHIERVMEIPERATVYGLHKTIQAAFAWTDTHLHYFASSTGVNFGGPGAEGTVPETGYTIRDVLPQVGSEATYFYDMGDSWEVSLKVLADGGRKRKYAKLQSGVGAAPFDDVGGTEGWKKVTSVAHRMLLEQQLELTGQEQEIRTILLSLGPERQVCRWITTFNPEATARRVAKVDIFSEQGSASRAGEVTQTHSSSSLTGSFPSARGSGHRLSLEKMDELRAANATALECIAQIINVPELTEMIEVLKDAPEGDFDQYELAEFATPLFDFLAYVDDEMQGVDCQEHVINHLEEFAVIFDLDATDPRLHLTVNEIFVGMMKMDLVEIVDETTVELTKQGLRILASQEDAKLVDYLIEKCPVANGTHILIPLVDILVLLMPGTIARLAVEYELDEVELRSKLMAAAVLTAEPYTTDAIATMYEALSVHNTILNITGMLMENPLDPGGPPIILSGAQKFFIKTLKRMDPERLLRCDWQ